MTYSIGTCCESAGSTSPSLLVRVKARDQEAWRRLVRLYGPLVAFWRRSTLAPAVSREAQHPRDPSRLIRNRRTRLIAWIAALRA